VSGFVRTVGGDLDPADLGRVDYHEHVFQRSPLLPGEDLDDEAASAGEIVELRDSGFDAMVDATPLGLGRRPEAIARIAQDSGVHVVLTTGVHRREHYGADHPLLNADAAALTAAFLRDLLEGAAEFGSAGPDAVRHADRTVRAGVLKAGLGLWRIDEHADRVLDAVAAAHAATGAPVMVHLEHGTAGFEVLERLEGLGVPSHRVALAHVDRNPDPGLHADLAAAGAYLGYDGAARSQYWPDSVLLDCLLATAAAGGTERILLGGDVARRSRYRRYGGMPGLRYLGDRFVPRLLGAAGAELVDAVLTANPARWLSWSR